MNSLDDAYQQSLDYLYSFVDYSLTHNLRFSPEKFDLARMHDLMARLDNPHQQYPVIHVAGTKGKGSTAAMIAAVLQSAGYRVGFYTSPHLEDFNERIQVNGESISRADLVDLVAQLRPHAAAVERITTFELTTALGFLYFARARVDVAVVEVGLGGRLDATNVVTPLVSVITSLSYDHMAVLGNTLAQIAAEKAGIIKPGRPVVLAPQKEEARLVVERIAAERAAPLTQVGRDVLFAPWTHSLEGQSLLIWSAEEQSLVDDFIESGGRSNWQPVRLTIPLLGHHQVENAATAYTALRTANAAGLPISEAAVQQGLRQTNWPGRFEVLRRDPPLVIDSAHNRDSALKLRLAVDDYFPGKRVVLLFGASEDKDIPGMFAELMPRVWQVIATQSIHPRAMPPEQLVALAHQFGVRARVVLPLEAALTEALQLAGSEALVLATGSIFVAAAVRSAWQAMKPGADQ
ncbi:MAG TPA: folylpolyglutamate synthase/dihydrofolate synthase family protein [Anaerolineaceae bacterium]|jgi:dihydrofolate synthase/folylpolyglutamate synthase|nr:folylpolyglutamate synthase/dihydrofolate synthase family protein [Anaerolineaceae bacterium]